MIKVRQTGELVWVKKPKKRLYGWYQGILANDMLSGKKAGQLINFRASHVVEGKL